MFQIIRIRTIFRSLDKYKNKTYGRYYNFIAGVLGSGQAFEGRVRRIQQKQFSG